MPAAFCTLVALACLACACTGYSYLEHTRATCHSSGALLDCAKYKAASLVHRIASSQAPIPLGPLRLVGIERGNTTEEETFLSRASTSTAQEPEVTRMFKYGLRQVEVFLQSHGLSVPLSSLDSTGPHLVYDDGTRTNTNTGGRGLHSKKKFALLFPLLVLIKFGIIKALLVPILLTLLFIKKVIVVGVMALPSLLSVLKACKVVSPYQGYHNSVYQPLVGVTGSDYGYGTDLTAYGAHGTYDSYGKDWSTTNQRRTRWGKATQSDLVTNDQTEQP